MLLWLWHRLAATAPIRPLVWDHPYAAGVAQKRPKKKKYIYIYILSEWINKQREAKRKDVNRKWIQTDPSGN